MAAEQGNVCIVYVTDTPRLAVYLLLPSYESLSFLYCIPPEKGLWFQFFLKKMLVYNKLLIKQYFWNKNNGIIYLDVIYSVLESQAEIPFLLTF